MTEIERIYREIEELREILKTLSYDVSQHRSEFEEFTKKKSLAQLSSDVKSIGLVFGKIGTRIMKIHEENQRNGVNPNS
ncbi:MAG: hypothetical protein U9Q18_04090 [Caldisericota bacterium]|nr:hypothetical protein [Caldisericota bacterium]